MHDGRGVIWSTFYTNCSKIQDTVLQKCHKRLLNSVEVEEAQHHPASGPVYSTFDPSALVMAENPLG